MGNLGLKRTITCLVLAVAGCQGSIRQHDETALPPQEAVAALPPESARARGPAAGDYRFDSLNQSHLWIHARLVNAPASIEAAIQLEGVQYPLPAGPWTERARRCATEPIAKAIREELTAGDPFRFVPTSWVYAGLGQIGGVVYLRNGHTLQDVLLRKGLARVRRGRARPAGLTAELEPSLIRYWLACENEARNHKRGFWSSRADLMERIGN